MLMFFRSLATNLMTLEKRPLLALPDNFKKIIITQSLRAPWIDEDGFLRIGLLDFLIDESILHR